MVSQVLIKVLDFYCVIVAQLTIHEHAVCLCLYVNFNIPKDSLGWGHQRDEPKEAWVVKAWVH